MQGKGHTGPETWAGPPVTQASTLVRGREAASASPGQTGPGAAHVGWERTGITTRGRQSQAGPPPPALGLQGCWGTKRSEMWPGLRLAPGSGEELHSVVSRKSGFPKTLADLRICHFPKEQIVPALSISS